MKSDNIVDGKSTSKELEVIENDKVKGDMTIIGTTITMKSDINVEQSLNIGKDLTVDKKSTFNGNELPKRAKL